MGEDGDMAARASPSSRWVVPVVALGVVAAVVVGTIVITARLATTDTMLAALSHPSRVCPSTGEVRTYCLLDQDMTVRRYGLAASGVSAALWTRYFACLSGLIMVTIGSVFILMKLEVRQGEADVQAAGWKVGLRTTSPGLALAIIGGALLAAAAYTPARLDIKDGPSFLRPLSAPVAVEAPPVDDRLAAHGPMPGPVKPKDRSR